MTDKEWAKMPRILQKEKVNFPKLTPLQAIQMVGFDNENEQKVVKIMTMPYFLLDDAQRRFGEYTGKYNLQHLEKAKAKQISMYFSNVNREVAKVLSLDDIVTMYEWADDAQQYYSREITILDMTTKNLYANFAETDIRDKVCDLLVIEVCVRIAKSFIEAHQGFKADNYVTMLHNSLRNYTDFVGNQKKGKIIYSQVFFENYEQAVNNLINRFVSFLGTQEEKQ